MEAVKASEDAKAAGSMRLQSSTTAEVLKARKITIEDFKGIPDLEFINLRVEIVLF